MGITENEKPFEDVFTHEACWDMGPVYSAADVVVCRAGAATLAEIAALGLPSLVVPWLRSAEHHQEENAACFSRMTGAPVFLENADAGDFLDALGKAKPCEKSGSEISGSEALYHFLCSFLQ